MEKIALEESMDSLMGPYMKAINRTPIKDRILRYNQDPSAYKSDHKSGKKVNLEES